MISLQNPGLVPLEAITTMGVNVKESENPIGFFGTGLKYAIASLLRTGQKITIWRGLEKLEFATATHAVRGKDFEFIFMNGERLGFTTHLGANWEPWQVFRELYSNMLDEQGRLEERRMNPAEGHTTIWVEGESFERAARERTKYFISGTPITASGAVEVYEGATQSVYYRGVMTQKLSKEAAFTYNITAPMTLTEDRTFRDAFYVPYRVQALIEESEDRAFLRKVLQSRGWERDMSFSGVTAEFAEVTLALVEEKGILSVSENAIAAAERFNQREAKFKELPLTAGDARDIEQAKAFLAKIGFHVTAEIVTAETLGPGVLGLARNEKIFLSRLCLTRGGNTLIGTLLEEHLHLTQGFLDESRAFQDFLIDLVVKLGRTV